MIATGKRVLIVEDVVDQVFATEKRLQREGCDTHLESTVDDAKRALASQHFDVLLVDARIPAAAGGPPELQGGLRLVRELREGRCGAENQSAPFFVLTAQMRRADIGDVDQFGNCLGLENKLRQHLAVDAIVRYLSRNVKG